jgi:hypothetical protein
MLRTVTLTAALLIGRTLTAVAGECSNDLSLVGNCAAQGWVWEKTGAQALRVPEGSDEQVIRLIFGDHQDVFWHIFTLRLSANRSTLTTHEVSQCALKAAPSQEIVLNAETAGRLRRIIEDRGFWEGRKKNFESAHAGDFRLVLNHNSVEGTRTTTSVCYIGLEVADLEAFGPLWDELRTALPAE